MDEWEEEEERASGGAGEQEKTGRWEDRKRGGWEERARWRAGERRKLEVPDGVFVRSEAT